MFGTVLGLYGAAIDAPAAGHTVGDPATGVWAAELEDCKFGAYCGGGHGGGEDGGTLGRSFPHGSC